VKRGNRKRQRGSGNTGGGGGGVRNGVDISGWEGGRGEGERVGERTGVEKKRRRERWRDTVRGVGGGEL